MLPLVLVDSAEQRPLEPFVIRDKHRIVLPAERANLEEGDYSLPGLTGPGGVAIERKSVADLWGTLFSSSSDPDALGEEQRGLDRFRRELERLRPYARAIIVVEGDKRSVYRYAEERAQRAWEEGRPWRQGVEERYRSVIGLVRSFFVDFGIPTEWAGSREGAALYVGETLTRIWEQHTGGPKARDALNRGHAAHLPWWRDTPTEAALEVNARAALTLATKARDADVQFAPAGGMPLTTSAAQQAREAAKRCR